MSVTSRVVRNARRRGVTVYTRKQWMPKRPKELAVYQWRRINRRHSLLPKQPVDTVVQHITVTRDTGDFKADLRTVHDIGKARFGSGISYNFVVDMNSGKVGLGQSLDAAGTHTLNEKNLPRFSFNQNYVAIAIAVLGMPGDELSHAAKLSITRLLAALIDEKAVRNGFDYMPHSAFAAKDCPCDSTRNAMPHMKKGAERLILNSFRGMWNW
jgi:hypothetical protein